MKTTEFTCRFVRPAAPLEPDKASIVDRLGQPVVVTTLERTVADLFDRPDLAGGAEELLNSLKLIGRLDVDRLVARLMANGNATAAGAAGWWLETRRHVLHIPDAALYAIHHRAPRRNRYALGRKGRGGERCDALGRDLAQRYHRAPVRRPLMGAPTIETFQRIVTMSAWKAQNVRQHLQSQRLGPLARRAKRIGAEGCGVVQTAGESDIAHAQAAGRGLIE